MPLGTVATLLGRATRKGLLLRDAGRYQLSPSRRLPDSSVGVEKERLAQAQLVLGRALLEFLAPRGQPVADAEAALDLILQFLLDQQVMVILGVSALAAPRNLSRAKSTLIAEFLELVVTNDMGLKAVLAGILEGLVLYH